MVYSSIIMYNSYMITLNKEVIMIIKKRNTKGRVIKLENAQKDVDVLLERLQGFQDQLTAFEHKYYNDDVFMLENYQPSIHMANKELNQLYFELINDNAELLNIIKGEK